MERRGLFRLAGGLAGASLLNRGSVSDLLAAAGQTSVMQPFRLNYGKDRIADLHRRIDSTVWPEMPFDTGWTAGTNDAVLHDLVRYWRQRYDWFAVQEELNKLTHLRGPIAGEQFHCVLHRATGQRQAFPIVLLYAWPDTFLEFRHVAPALARGVDGGPAFDVVVPSFPGFPFSDPPRAPGMTVARIAERIHLLMRELGYGRYGVQGAGWGAYIGSELALRYPSEVVGLHMHWVDEASTGQPRPAVARQTDRSVNRGDFYIQVQGTTPQSLCYALQDSPVGWLGWMLLRYWSMSDHDKDMWGKWDRDHILTTAMIYWLSGRILSAIRLYWETDTGRSGVPYYQPSAPISVPVGYARFGGAPPRDRIQSIYPHIVHYSEPSPLNWRYAMMQAPAVFAKDVSQFFTELKA